MRVGRSTMGRDSWIGDSAYMAVEEEEVVTSRVELIWQQPTNQPMMKIARLMDLDSIPCHAMCRCCC